MKKLFLAYYKLLLPLIIYHNNRAACLLPVIEAVAEVVIEEVAEEGVEEAVEEGIEEAVEEATEAAEDAAEEAAEEIGEEAAEDSIEDITPSEENDIMDSISSDNDIADVADSDDVPTDPEGAPEDLEDLTDDVGDTDVEQDEEDVNDSLDPEQEQQQEYINKITTNTQINPADEDSSDISEAIEDSDDAEEETDDNDLQCTRGFNKGINKLSQRGLLHGKTKSSRLTLRQATCTNDKPSGQNSANQSRLLNEAKVQAKNALQKLKDIAKGLRIGLRKCLAPCYSAATAGSGSTGDLFFLGGVISSVIFPSIVIGVGVHELLGDNGHTPKLLNNGPIELYRTERSNNDGFMLSKSTIPKKIAPLPNDLGMTTFYGASLYNSKVPVSSSSSIDLYISNNGPTGLSWELLKKDIPISDPSSLISWEYTLTEDQAIYSNGIYAISMIDNLGNKYISNPIISNISIDEYNYGEGQNVKISGYVRTSSVNAISSLEQATNQISTVSTDISDITSSSNIANIQSSPNEAIILIDNVKVGTATLSPIKNIDTIYKYEFDAGKLPAGKYLVTVIYQTGNWSTYVEVASPLAITNSPCPCDAGNDVTIYFNTPSVVPGGNVVSAYNIK